MSKSHTLHAFNKAHQNVQFTLVKEDVYLSCRVDGSARLSVHRDATWNTQSIHFNSFVPLRIKRNLIRCLINKVPEICTEYSTEKELLFLRNVFRRNDYSERFIDENMEQADERHKKAIVEKYTLYISLHFKGCSSGSHLSLIARSCR